MSLNSNETFIKGIYFLETMCTDKEKNQHKRKGILDLQIANNKFNLNPQILLNSEVWIDHFSKYFSEKLTQYREKNKTFYIISTHNPLYHQNFNIKSADDITYTKNEYTQLDEILIAFKPIDDEHSIFIKNNRIDVPLKYPHISANDYEITTKSMMLSLGPSNILLMENIIFYDPHNFKTGVNIDIKD